MMEGRGSCNREGKKRGREQKAGKTNLKHASFGTTSKNKKREKQKNDFERGVARASCSRKPPLKEEGKKGTRKTKKAAASRG